MISLQNVYKTYPTNAGRKVVLADVNVAFEACESVGILGRNGAGKSTLLRILSGVEKPDSGTVMRNGRVSWPIGFSGGFSPSLTGEENARFVARIYGESHQRVVESAKGFADLGDYFRMPVRTYSSGMRARLAFALSMAIDFDIYLVDEITAVGDKSFQEKCRKAFADRQARSSVIIVSHHLGTIRSYCKRCAVLSGGQLRVYDSVTDAARHYDSEAA
jgi:capsular polysaccharide transport system ATP-binding protein